MKKAANVSLILGIVFFIVGFVFLGAGTLMLVHENEFKKTAVETSATITDIQSYSDTNGDIQYDVYIAFDVDGKRYSGRLNAYSSSMDVGEAVSIYYDPDNPNEFMYGSATVGFIIFIALGGLFSLVGLGIVISSIMKKKKKKRLLSSNVIIQANIVSFDYDRSISVNHRHPFMLIASAISPYDGMTYNFKSEPIWNDLGPILEQYNIKTVPVYVNPQNYKEYHVDIDYFKNYLGN